MYLNFKTLVGALAVLSIASCSKNDVFDAQQAAANEIAQKKTTFENNFVAKYGQVAPTQSWDFSTNQQRLGTRGEGDQIVTKTVDGLDFGQNYTITRSGSKLNLNRKVTKNQEVLTNVSNKLKDGDKHYDVQKAVLVAPSSSFTIYPISAQGAWTHDLYVKVGDTKPVKVYSKNWTDFSRPFVNGDALNGVVKEGYIQYSWGLSYGYWYEVTSRVVMPGLYIEAPVGTPIEIYLDNVKNGDTKKPSVGTSTGNVIYVDGKGAVPEGVEIREDAIIKYVGIEDQENMGDRDYNDVVLAIVGNPDVPEEIKIENEEYKVPVSLTKRYMMEDLGSTDDFDFNDVVVDVTETTVYTHKVTIVNGVKTADDVIDTKKSQKAVVRHLGGIYPFILKVGDTTFDEMGGKDTFDKDVEIEKVVTGWNPAQNNVSVTVKSTESQMYTNEFPKTGAFPMMFACDPSKKWYSERQKFDFEKEFGVSFTK